MVESEQEEKKLARFLEWLQANEVDLRACAIKYSDQTKGLGIFSTSDVHYYPLIGPVCRAMFKEGEVDDRFLIILFLLLERLRKNSTWKPHLDMLPSLFGNPLWFSDQELLELKRTALYRATELHVFLFVITDQMVSVSELLIRCLCDER